MATLLILEVRFASAWEPKPVLKDPDLFWNKAPDPTAVLPEPFCQEILGVATNVPVPLLL